MFLELSFKSCLYIFEINSLSVASFAIIFSHSEGCLFTLLIVSRVMEIKAKINKSDLIKIKSFCAMKETISKVKRQPSEWEKIITNEATDKELVSKMY